MYTISFDYVVNSAFSNELHKQLFIQTFCITHIERVHGVYLFSYLKFPVCGLCFTLIIEEEEKNICIHGRMYLFVTSYSTIAVISLRAYYYFNLRSYLVY